MGLSGLTGQKATSDTKMDHEQIDGNLSQFRELSSDERRKGSQFEWLIANYLVRVAAIMSSATGPTELNWSEGSVTTETVQVDPGMGANDDRRTLDVNTAADGIVLAESVMRGSISFAGITARGSLATSPWSGWFAFADAATTTETPRSVSTECINNNYTGAIIVALS